jgi:hypothetical protein
MTSTDLTKTSHDHHAVMRATKIDLVREFKELYAPGREPATVEVPGFSFLMVDGHGDPNVAPGYGHAVEALYSVSYTLKFALRRGPQGLDYRVMPLEGLWWAPDMSAFTIEDKSAWDWTMMIRQPEQVDEDLFEQALAKATRKKELPAANLLRLERFAEGLAAQVMHTGPYASEGPTIRRLHAFIADQGYERAGKHHEIYLSDPRRAAPEKMKTVLRQPMARSGEADPRR